MPHFSPCKHRIHPLFTVQTSNPSSFHRANTSSFPQYIKSYLTKNACHSTTPIPQGDTIKCHSEATPKNLVVAPARERLFHPHFTARMSNAPTSKNACCLCRMDCRLACHSDVAVPRIILRLTRSIASTVRTTSLFVILSGAKNLVVAPARGCLSHPLSHQRHAFHRANTSSFPQYIKSYLTKNTCHSTTPIPQGNTIKCHSERQRRISS